MIVNRILAQLLLSFMLQTSLSAGTQHQQLVNLWLREQPTDVPNKCGLPAISYALQNRSRLKASELLALNSILVRPTLQKSVVRGHFRIHYDTVGVHEPAMLDAQRRRIVGTANEYADSVGAILDYAYRYETDSLGYAPPPADDGSGGGQEYDVYVQDLGSSYYGFTTPETPINGKPNGGTYTSFITTDNDFTFVAPFSNQGLPALRVTLAHELHHAIQMGNHGYWSGDISFYEITSVWMEDVVYTDVNDYYQYTNSMNGQFAQPQVSFVSNQFIMYSRSIWCHYLAKRFGRDIVRRMWQEIGNVPPLNAMDIVLSKPEFASSFRNAFAEWSTWNFFTGSRNDSVRYYPEGGHYRTIAPASSAFSGTARTIVGSVAPCASKYFDVGGVLSLVVTNVNVSAAATDETQSFSFSIQLNQKRVDNNYFSTSAAIFVKLDAPDPTNWFIKDLFGISGAQSPFPNPYLVGDNRFLYFPLSTPNQSTGSVSIFSTSMDLVYSSSQVSVFLPELGMQALRWNGMNENNRIVGSGIYFYVVEGPAGASKGKVAIIRK
ncbi:MAG: hypothetical protein HY961_19835 [Ignavibacteriae bacterium]|nr:hypothetical protein [Ignavibacteriota bacterium]